MDLRTIKTFKTIEKYGSFQRAAEDLKYAQSTITTHIKKLESDLGVTLLDRGNNLQLTEAGRLLSEKGELLLKTYEHLQSSMSDLIKGESGTLRIGVMEPMASYRFPHIITKFMEEFPAIQLSLQVHGSRVLSEMVERDEIEVAFCAAADMNNGTVFEPLFSEKVGLLIPSEHHLSKKEVVALKDMQEEQLVLTSPSCPIRGNFEQRMIELGIPLSSSRIEISNLLSLKYYVQCGFGVGIVPLITVNPAPKGTVVRPIIDFPKGVTVGIMRKAEFQSNKPIQSLLDTVKSVHY